MGNTVSEEPPLVSLLENELPFSLKNGKRPASEYVLGWENATQLAPRDMSKLKRSFAPAGQSTQMIIGATGESDYTLLQTTQALYQGFDLKRVFYSAYIPLNEEAVLPQIGTPPPLLREHRLYQADWLLRFYGFQAGELLSPEKPDFNELVDPKCDWALRHLDQFPCGSGDCRLCRPASCSGIGQSQPAGS